MFTLRNKHIIVIGAADGVPATAIAEALRLCGHNPALLINQYFV